MLNKATYNPAVPGSTDQGDGVFFLRMPQLGMKDVEGNSINNTQWGITLHAPLKKLSSGIGVSFYNDQNGLFETMNQLSLMYAYQLKIGEGRLGIGLQGGMYQLAYDFTKAKYPGSLTGGESQGTGSDSYIDKLGSEKMTIFHIGGGLFYKISDLYFGVSMKNINSPKLKGTEGKYKYYVPHTYIMAGYTYNTSNPLITLNPSMLYKFSSMLNSPQLNIDLLVEYNRFLIIGAEYTTSNDVTFILGANFKDGSKLDGLRVAASYDIITSKLGEYSKLRANLEAVIGYTFNMSVEKIAKTYKSVRFL